MTLRVLLCAALLYQALANASDLLIRNVTVVDVKTGDELPHRSVLIHNDRIISLAPGARVLRSAHVVNGAGKYVIPGLWDMHVHLWYRDHQFPMYLAWGITGVRDMGSDLAQIKRWRSEIKAGTLLGPHIETAGPPVDGFPSEDPKLPVIIVRTPDQARNTYDDLEQKLNVDFIKVRSRLPRDAYFALLDRARKWGLPVAGDVPDSVSADEAVSSRQDSIEKLSGVLLACATEERRIRPERMYAIERKDIATVTSLDDRILNSFSRNKADALLARMATFACYQTPALLMLRRCAHAGADESLGDLHLKYVPAAIRKTWPDPRAENKELSAATLSVLARQYQASIDLVRQMQVRGVPLMAGTGTGAPYTFPGYDLHRELELLVKAGLTPLEALRAATITPARFLDADESLGAVAPGKMADLVILDADPLKDIRNTLKIAGVVVSGKYLSRAKLDSMLIAGRK